MTGPDGPDVIFRWSLGVFLGLLSMVDWGAVAFVMPFVITIGGVLWWTWSWLGAAERQRREMIRELREISYQLKRVVDKLDR